MHAILRWKDIEMQDSNKETDTCGMRERSSSDKNFRKYRRDGVPIVFGGDTMALLVCKQRGTLSASMGPLASAAHTELALAIAVWGASIWHLIIGHTGQPM
jgi:hypothetical protein